MVIYIVDIFYKQISILTLGYSTTKSHPPTINCVNRVNKCVFRQSMVEGVIPKTWVLPCVCLRPP